MMTVMLPDIFIGTQGWDYPSWKENFYGKTPRNKFLEFYANQFTFVEIASSRHRIPTQSTVDHWIAATPPSFAFSAKMPDVITHEKNLLHAESETRAFLSTMSRLDEKLHVIVLEFAPSFKFEMLPDLDKYLEWLPKDFRYAVEIRNKSWLNEEFYQMLSRHNVALAVSESPSIPHISIVTTDFAFVRLIGKWSDVPYGQFERIVIDRSKEIGLWANDIVENKKKGIRTYCMVNNHFAGHAPGSARMLEKELARLLKK